MLRRLTAVVLLGGLASCYSPSYRDCQVACGTGTCPEGLECDTNLGVCRPPGASGPCMSPDADVDGIAIDEFLTGTVDAICARLTRCGGFETEAACTQLLGNQLRQRPELVAAVRAGRVMYDPIAAQTCLDAVAAASCVRSDTPFGPFDVLEMCRRVIGGTVTESGACTISEECISMSCNKATDCTTDCCAGTCAPGAAPRARAVGESCGPQDQCIDGYCDANGICAADKQNGEVCVTSTECGEDSFCGGTGTAASCQPLAQTGGPCFKTAECRDLSNVCSGGACVVGGLPGFACTLNGDDCQTAHICDQQQLRCALPPMIGESCPQGGCYDGYCKQPDMICTARGADGATCNPMLGGADCASFFCSSATLTCEPPPACF